MRKADSPLTDAAIKAAQRAKRSGRLRDGLRPGLSLRLRPGWTPLWTFSFTRPDGRRSELTLGPLGSRSPALTLEGARQEVDRLRTELRKGRDPLAKRETERRERAAQRRARIAAGPDGPLPGSFGELARLYLRDARKKDGSPKRSLPEDRRKLERDVLPLWRDRAAGKITRGDVRALVAGIAAGEGNRARPGRPAPVAANRTRALLSRVYAFALEMEYPGVDSNPAYRLTPPGSERSRERVLNPAELRALWEATEAEPLGPRVAVRLLLATALRRGELLGARWRDIEADGSGAWLAVPAERSKNGRSLRIPLSTLARELIAELAPTAHAEFLFPGPSGAAPLGDMKRTVDRLRQRVAELAGPEADPARWVLHDLRRTARTLLGACGVAHGIAERMLGHLAPEARGVAAVYDRYAYGPERMAAAEALARRLREIVSGSAPGAVLPFLPNRRG